MSHKITYFDIRAKSIKDIIFKGVKSFEDAIEWGKKNISNFSIALINKA